jgi:hypothetical protein
MAAPKRARKAPVGPLVPIFGKYDVSKLTWSNVIQELKGIFDFKNTQDWQTLTTSSDVSTPPLVKFLHFAYFMTKHEEPDKKQPGFFSLPPKNSIFRELVLTMTMPFAQLTEDAEWTLALLGSGSWELKGTPEFVPSRSKDSQATLQALFFALPSLQGVPVDELNNIATDKKQAGVQSSRDRLSSIVLNWISTLETALESKDSQLQQVINLFSESDEVKREVETWKNDKNRWPDKTDRRYLAWMFPRGTDNFWYPKGQLGTLCGDGKKHVRNALFPMSSWPAFYVIQHGAVVRQQFFWRRLMVAAMNDYAKTAKPGQLHWRAFMDEIRVGKNFDPRTLPVVRSPDAGDVKAVDRPQAAPPSNPPPSQDVERSTEGDTKTQAKPAAAKLDDVITQLEDLIRRDTPAEDLERLLRPSLDRLTDEDKRTVRHYLNMQEGIDHTPDRTAGGLIKWARVLANVQGQEKRLLRVQSVALRNAWEKLQKAVANVYTRLRLTSINPDVTDWERKTAKAGYVALRDFINRLRHQTQFDGVGRIQYDIQVVDWLINTEKDDRKIPLPLVTQPPKHLDNDVRADFDAAIKQLTKPPRPAMPDHPPPVVQAATDIKSVKAQLETSISDGTPASQLRTDFGDIIKALGPSGQRVSNAIIDAQEVLDASRKLEEVASFKDWAMDLVWVERHRDDLLPGQKDRLDHDWKYLRQDVMKAHEQWSEEKAKELSKAIANLSRDFPAVQPLADIHTALLNAPKQTPPPSQPSQSLGARAIEKLTDLGSKVKTLVTSRFAGSSEPEPSNPDPKPVNATGLTDWATELANISMKPDQVQLDDLKEEWNKLRESVINAYADWRQLGTEAAKAEANALVENIQQLRLKYRTVSALDTINYDLDAVAWWLDAEAGRVSKDTIPDVPLLLEERYRTRFKAQIDKHKSSQPFPAGPERSPSPESRRRRSRELVTESTTKEEARGVLSPSEIEKKIDKYTFDSTDRPFARGNNPTALDVRDYFKLASKPSKAFTGSLLAYEFRAWMSTQLHRESRSKDAWDGVPEQHYEQAVAWHEHTKMTTFELYALHVIRLLREIRERGMEAVEGDFVNPSDLSSRLAGDEAVRGLLSDSTKAEPGVFAKTMALVARQSKYSWATAIQELIERKKQKIGVVIDQRGTQVWSVAIDRRDDVLMAGGGARRLMSLIRFLTLYGKWIGLSPPRLNVTKSEREAIEIAAETKDELAGVRARAKEFGEFLERSKPTENQDDYDSDDERDDRHKHLTASGGSRDAPSEQASSSSQPASSSTLPKGYRSGFHTSTSLV